ncbi:MAG: hypothetical protein JXB23_04695 [Candidatus Aminicenantes bacterium]|nr:hypothetical protein [Candidatus Aminicenantes bacterium]
MRSAKFFVISVIMGVCAAGFLSGAIPSSERSALIALYNNTGGSSWYVRDNWKKPPLAADGFALPGTEKDWYGVICDTGNTKVLRLELGYNNLSGTIPAQISNLTQLEELRLYGNSLTGGIPAQLGSLSHLTNLDLGQNNLGGDIPSVLGNLSNLKKLHLDSNQLTGSIPSSLGNLSQLERLVLASNELTGSIPGELANCSNLEYLVLSYNQIIGNIPSALGDLAKLEGLYIYANQLSGTLPSSLGNLSSLKELALADNAFESGIPSALGNLSSLFSLDLSQNLLTGEIPSSFGKLAGLGGLYLYENQLSGNIPPELGSCSSLTELYLGNNAFIGNIPAGLVNLASLRTLDLNHNQLTGGVPKWLALLSNLGYLDLSHNQLSGKIGSQSVQDQSEAFEMGYLANLWYLDLSHNMLSGTISTVLGQLTSLRKFYLNSNNLKGSIPSTLMNLTDLTLADFSYNALYTENSALRTFLNGVDPGWENTQTIAPKGLSLVYLSASVAEVSWIPIAYTEDGGGYKLQYSLTPGGSYSYYGMTADKTVSSMEFVFPDPGQTYYLVVVTKTDPHSENLNTVYSRNSTEVTTADKPEINVRYGSKKFADGGAYNLGTKPASLIKTNNFLIWIENLGNSPVLLTGVPLVELTGADAAKFEVTQPVTDRIAPGEKKAFYLKAKATWVDLPPGSSETVTFGFLIANNDGNENPYNFTITVKVLY